MASIEDKKVWDEMKIVIIGGTGLIGTQLVRQLKQEGHEVIAAAPSTGVNSLTGEGLGHALAGAAVDELCRVVKGENGGLVGIFQITAAAGVAHAGFDE